MITNFDAILRLEESANSGETPFFISLDSFKLHFLEWSCEIDDSLSFWKHVLGRKRIRKVELESTVCVTLRIVFYCFRKSQNINQLKELYFV